MSNTDVSHGCERPTLLRVLESKLATNKYDSAQDFLAAVSSYASHVLPGNTPFDSSFGGLIFPKGEGGHCLRFTT